MESPRVPAVDPQSPAGYYPPAYTPEPTTKPPAWKRAGGLIIAAGLLLLKFGAKLKGLLLLLPKLKIFTTSASALVSVGAYALLYTWKFAVGLVLLLFVHEMGHVFQLRREGIKASAPMFIPFLGAVVAMKELPEDAAAEARVGLAGPVIGSLGALIPLAIYGLTGNELFQVLAYVGFFLNLFNLAPISPLDGGRIVAAIHPALWIVGLLALVGLTIVAPNPILILILILGGFESWRRWQHRRNPESEAYYRVSPSHRVITGVSYIVLAALLTLGMSGTFVERDI